MGVISIVAAFSALAASTTQSPTMRERRDESNEAAYVHFLRGEWLRLNEERTEARNEFRYTKVFAPESRVLQQRLRRY